REISVIIPGKRQDERETAKAATLRPMRSGTAWSRPDSQSSAGVFSLRSVVVAAPGSQRTNSPWPLQTNAEPRTTTKTISNTRANSARSWRRESIPGRCAILIVANERRASLCELPNRSDNRDNGGTDAPCDAAMRVAGDAIDRERAGAYEGD